jgi:peptidoglycan hydrolase-like protein with peptidoglycan-binding domain
MHKALLTVIALAFVPAGAMAQIPQEQQDTLRVQEQEDFGRVDAEVRGPAREGEFNLGLTREQVRELQVALHDQDCNPGIADGIIGPRTRAAMACVREAHNIQSIDPNVLLHALELDFMSEYRDDERVQPQPQPMPQPQPQPVPQPQPQPVPQVEPQPERQMEPMPEPQPPIETMEEPTPELEPEPQPLPPPAR